MIDYDVDDDILTMWKFFTTLLTICLILLSMYFVFPKTKVFAENVRLQAKYERLIYDGVNVKIIGGEK